MKNLPYSHLRKTRIPICCQFKYDADDNYCRCALRWTLDNDVHTQDIFILAYCKLRNTVFYDMKKCLLQHENYLLLDSYGAPLSFCFYTMYLSSLGVIMWERSFCYFLRCGYTFHLVEVVLKIENSIEGDIEFSGNICYLSSFFLFSDNTSTQNVIYMMTEHIQNFNVFISFLSAQIPFVTITDCTRRITLAPLNFVFTWLTQVENKNLHTFYVFHNIGYF